MQLSESCEPTTSQNSTCGPNQKLLVALSLILLTESLANPKAGCHYLDQTSQAQVAHVDQTLSHQQMSELIMTMCNVTVEKSRVGCTRVFNPAVCYLIRMSEFLFVG